MQSIRIMDQHKQHQGKKPNQLMQFYTFQSNTCKAD